MSLITNINKNKVSLIFLIAFLSIIFVSLLSKHYDMDDNFSGTYKHVVLIVLIVFMISSFNNYICISLLFATALIFYYKDDLNYIQKEAFGDKILKGELNSTKKQLEMANRELGTLKSDNKRFEKDLEKAQDAGAKAIAEKKSLQRDLDMIKGTNESLSKESGNEKCKNAKEVLSDKTAYTSKVQKKAQETMEQCMENFSNLAGFKDNTIQSNPNNSVNHMISNFKTLHGFNSQKITSKLATPDNKITTETKLLPVNTRFF